MAAAWAQTAPAPATTATQDSTSTPAPTDPNAPTAKRLFGVLPNFVTVENGGLLPPLTAGGKWALVAEGTFDPVEFIFVGAVAGTAQWSNSDPTWGQGLKGYGRRYAAAYADQSIGNFMTGAFLPGLLHQDPRYYRLGKGSALHRIGYAASRIVVAQHDGTGAKSFNIAELSGNLAAAGISNLYSPRSERTWSNTASTWGLQIMWDALSWESREFWPDARNWLARNHKPTPVPPAAPTSH